MKNIISILLSTSGLSFVGLFIGTQTTLALNFYGDSILTPEGNSIFLSTNFQAEEDSNLGNEIGNAYNLSGNSAISAFDLETELNVDDGFLSPDIDNFVEAFEGSAIKKRFEFPSNFTYNFGWTFYSNDVRREIENLETLETIDASDYAFLLVKQIEIDEETQVETETLVDFVRLASVNSSENSGFFRPSNTAGGVRERLENNDFIPVIERPFVREKSGVYDLEFSEKGIYEISFGVLDVDDFGDSTSAIAIWERDFGDAPDSPVNSEFFYDTLLQNNGPRYYEGEFQRLGILRDSENDGRPTLPANGDDAIASTFVFSEQSDDEDGVIFDENWIDVIFNISRLGDYPYQLRAWGDFNNNKIFDHPDELFIDDLLTLNPNTIPNDPAITVLGEGLFKKRYFVGDLKDVYKRFRLTWDPINLDITPQGEFFSSSDCDGIPNNYCVAYGEVEDYPPIGGGSGIGILEPSTLYGLFTLAFLSSFKKKKH